MPTMSMASRREYLAAIYRRYRHATKREKSVMLNEFGRATGYQRKYATRLLNAPFRRTPVRAVDAGAPTRTKIRTT